MFEEKKEKKEISSKYVLLLVGNRKCLIASDIGYHGVFMFSSEKELEERLVKKVNHHFECKNEFMIICTTKRCTITNKMFKAMFAENFNDDIYFERVDQVNVTNSEEVKKDLIEFVRIPSDAIILPSQLPL